MIPLTPSEHDALGLCWLRDCSNCQRRKDAIEALVRKNVAAVFADQYADERRAAEVVA